ncbi:morphogenetic protein [Pseudomonas phage phiZ98]|nr:morphogenetic protein [Pseudomonas phage phiZ98]
MVVVLQPLCSSFGDERPGRFIREDRLIQTFRCIHFTTKGTVGDFCDGRLLTYESCCRELDACEKRCHRLRRDASLPGNHGHGCFR